MITLIGTGHVFNLTQPLLHIFDEKQPDLLCIELDRQRYQGLMLKKSDPGKYKEASKNQPILYKLLSRFQDGMAKEYGTEAGQEMITTINYAKEHNLPLAFIDINAQYLFRRMFKKMSLKEKLALVFSGFGGLFVSKKKVEKELENIQNNFDFYMKEIGKKFPTLKRVLIDERNIYMVKQLIEAQEKFDKIIAIVGDGHIPGLKEILETKDVEYKTIRLKELRSFDKSIDNSMTASFSFEQKQV